MTKNKRGGLRTRTDSLSIKTKGKKTRYDREIIDGIPTRMHILPNSINLASPPAESTTSWITTAWGGVRARPDPIAIKTRGLKTTYEIRNKGGVHIYLTNDHRAIVLSNSHRKLVMRNT